MQPFATDWGGVAIETAPNGDLVSVNPVNFEQSGLGTVTRIVYRQPAPPAAPAAAAAAARGARRAGPHGTPPAPALGQTAPRAHLRHRLRRQRRPERDGLGAAPAAPRRLLLVAAAEATDEHGEAALRPAALDEGEAGQA